MRLLDQLLLRISIFVLLALFLNQLRKSDSFINILDPWLKMSGLKAGDTFPDGVKFS